MSLHYYNDWSYSGVIKVWHEHLPALKGKRDNMKLLRGDKSPWGLSFLRMNLLMGDRQPRMWNAVVMFQKKIWHVHKCKYRCPVTVCVGSKLKDEAGVHVQKISSFDARQVYQTVALHLNYVFFPSVRFAPGYSRPADHPYEILSISNLKFALITAAKSLGSLSDLLLNQISFSLPYGWWNCCYDFAVAVSTLSLSFSTPLTLQPFLWQPILDHCSTPSYWLAMRGVWIMAEISLPCN